MEKENLYVLKDKFGKNIYWESLSVAFCDIIGYIKTEINNEITELPLLLSLWTGHSIYVDIVDSGKRENPFKVNRYYYKVCDLSGEEYQEFFNGYKISDFVKQNSERICNCIKFEGEITICHYSVEVELL